MMRRMRHSPHHHPCTRSRHIEKLHVSFPPRCIPRLQSSHPLPAVLCVPSDEVQPHLPRWQRRCSHVNPEHIAEPKIFAHALMHHLLAHAAAPWISFLGANWKILILEFAPYPKHLDSLGVVALN